MTLDLCLKAEDVVPHELRAVLKRCHWQHEPNRPFMFFNRDLCLKWGEIIKERFPVHWKDKEHALSHTFSSNNFYITRVSFCLATVRIKKSCCWQPHKKIQL